VLVALVVGLIIRIVWVWRQGGFRAAADSPAATGPSTPTYPEVWTRATDNRSPRLARPRDVPRPESPEEVTVWAGLEDFRHTVLIYAPVFWVLLPLAALAFLIQQTITDPTGADVNITINDESVDGWPTWLVWLLWFGVGIWLFVAIGVLLLRLSVFRDLRAENQWIYERGVAHSIHRASVDYDDGEASWPTYIVLDHRLDDEKAARIHEAFEQWLSLAALPPSGSAPVPSARLFGAQAEGGYFFLHLPVSQTADATTEYRWLLITRPRDTEDDLIVTPVPVAKRLRKIRVKLDRKAARAGRP